MQYYKGEHGTHISYNPAERPELEKNGWTLIGDEEAFIKSRTTTTAPSNKLAAPNRGVELKDKTIPELKIIAEDLGLTIHSRAKENSIIEKILAAEKVLDAE